MSVEIIVAIGVGLFQLGLTGVVLATLIAPEQSVFKVDKIPVLWRLFLLFCVSILSGIIIQVAGLSYRLN